MRLNKAINNSEWQLNRKVDGVNVYHLENMYRLPDFEEPSPRADIVNDRYTVLIIAYVRGDLESWDFEMPMLYLRSALWSRNSWLVNSDAIEHGVDVKLYIEDVLFEHAKDWLVEQHIDLERDVITFSCPLIEPELRTQSYQSGRWAYWGRKMVSFWDPQLSSYERIVCCDSDTYVASPPGFRFDFFEKLENLTDYQKTACAHFNYGQNNNMWYDFMQSLEDRAQGYSLADISKILHIDFRSLSHTFLRPKGWMWSYPAKYFHESKPETVEWIRKAAMIMGWDEFVMACAYEILGVDHFYMQDEFDMTYINCVGMTEPCIAHGRPYQSVEFRNAADEDKKSVALQVEKEWRDAIGVE